MDDLFTAVRELLFRIWLYIRSLAKWLLLAVPVGLLCGGLGSAFHIGVEYATELRGSHPWLLYLLPIGGLAIVGIYRFFSVEGQSTDSVIDEVQSGRGLKILLIPAIFLSTLITHLLGGSAGREGAALQMGGAIGFEFGKLLRFDDRDLRTATMAGMAAFFSALFGTPVGATFFAIAVISVGLVYHAALIPCLFSSLTAYGVSLFFSVEPTRFTVLFPVIDALMLLRCAALAVLCALVSMLFCEFLHRTERFSERFLPSPWLRAAAGGALLVLLSLLIPGGDYNGAGMSVIRGAVEGGQAKTAAFLLKILFTTITLAAGFKGGEVVPCFFIGATFGCVVGPLLGIPAGFAAALGLISVFCASVNCPIGSIFLAVELFGGQGLLCYAICCTVSFVLSGYDGLYSGQKIVYDKLKALYIDVHTNAWHEEAVKDDTRSRN